MKSKDSNKPRVMGCSALEYIFLNSVDEREDCTNTSYFELGFKHSFTLFSRILRGMA